MPLKWPAVPERDKAIGGTRSPNRRVKAALSIQCPSRIAPERSSRRRTERIPNPYSLGRSCYRRSVRCRSRWIYCSPRGPESDAGEVQGAARNQGPLKIRRIDAGNDPTSSESGDRTNYLLAVLSLTSTSRRPTRRALHIEPPDVGLDAQGMGDRHPVLRPVLPEVVRLAVHVSGAPDGLCFRRSRIRQWRHEYVAGDTRPRPRGFLRVVRILVVIGGPGDLHDGDRSPRRQGAHICAGVALPFRDVVARGPRRKGIAILGRNQGDDRRWPPMASCRAHEGRIPEGDGRGSYSSMLRMRPPRTVKAVTHVLAG